MEKVKELFGKIWNCELVLFIRMAAMFFAVIGMPMFVLVTFQKNAAISLCEAIVYGFAIKPLLVRMSDVVERLMGTKK